ncbi:MAG: hypothetical protein IKS48_12090 [Eubacterium sp.]|nr:hypothetical protein [Eubacterium sp.]
MSDIEKTEYLRRYARNKLDFAHNHYKQKYKALCTSEKSDRDKCKAIGITLLFVSAIVLLLRFIIYIIKAFVIDSTATDYMMNIFNKVETMGLIVALLVIFGLGVYFVKIHGKYWNWNNRSIDNIKEKNIYLAKVNMLERMLEELDSLSEDELVAIINKEVEDF